MLFLIVFGVPEKSVFTRLFDLFASASLANFQDRLVMTASICLRVKIFIVAKSHIKPDARLLYHFVYQMSIAKLKNLLSWAKNLP